MHGESEKRIGQFAQKTIQNFVEYGESDDYVM